MKRPLSILANYCNPVSGELGVRTPISSQKFPIRFEINNGDGKSEEGSQTFSALRMVPENECRARGAANHRLLQ